MKSNSLFYQNLQQLQSQLLKKTEKFLFTKSKKKNNKNYYKRYF